MAPVKEEAKSEKSTSTVKSTPTIKSTPSSKIQTIQSTQPTVKYQSTTTAATSTQSYSGQITPTLVTPLSPYYKKIKISSLNYAIGSGGYTTIKLSANLQKEESINITNWRLKSNTQSIVIPQAIENFPVSYPWIVKDIVVLAGHTLNIYSNYSVIGQNLRLNKCIGYLENYYKFNPPLSQSCPSPTKRTDFTDLSGSCQSYVLSLSGCKEVDVNSYNSLDNACRAFLNTIGTYGNCYSKYSSDADFLSKDWRVWIGQNILDSKHDRIRLFDKDGLLVDEYYY